TLTACGSATVESGSEVSPDATVAPLERGDGDLSSSSESETSEERSSKETKESTEASTSKSEPAPEDRGAQEVEQAPSTKDDTSNDGFLDAVVGGVVDITGVENHLVRAAHSAFNPDDVLTILAVAGQLVDQERTDKNVDEVV